MAKKFNIFQSKNKLERQVPASLVKKLYQLITQPNGYDEDNTELVGKFETGFTYDVYLNAICGEKDENGNIISMGAFPDLEITVQGLYVYFEDTGLEAYIKEKRIDIDFPNNEYEGVINTLASINTSGRSQDWGFKRIFAQRIGNTIPSDAASKYPITTFDELKQLTKMTSIAESEFYNVKTLTSIDLTNITKFGNNAFHGADNLIYFNGRNSDIGSLSLPNLQSDGLSNASVFQCDMDSNRIYRGPQVKTIVDLGNATQLAGFQYNTSLEHIEDGVLHNIQKINDNAFRGCEQLEIENLDLPNCKSIGNYSFNLTRVKNISNLGIGCQIGNNAFQGCSELKSFIEDGDEHKTLSNILTIGTSAFSGCSQLEIDDLKLPNLSSIGNYAFNNAKIKKISDLGAVTKVTGFDNNTLLTDIIFPPTATTLGQSCFNGCTLLNIPNLSVIQVFENYACKGCTSFTGILCLPQLNTIGFSVFKNTNINSLYLPNLKNTNGHDGASVPWGNRGEGTLHTTNSMNIIYFKNLEKINGFALGGDSHASWQGTIHQDDISSHLHTVGNVNLYEYKGNPMFYRNGDNYGYDQWGGEKTNYGNIKYVVINRLTPPDYWQSFGTRYGGFYYGSWSLYQKNETGSSETFKYLVVPRAAINDYKNWDAFNPEFTDPNIKESNKEAMISSTRFDVNTRIIALESMHHVATKAEWDALTDARKNEYLIEEYMGLSGESINWDSTPTWPD